MRTRILVALILVTCGIATLVWLARIAQQPEIVVVEIDLDEVVQRYEPAWKYYTAMDDGVWAYQDSLHAFPVSHEDLLTFMSANGMEPDSALILTRDEAVGVRDFVCHYTALYDSTGAAGAYDGYAIDVVHVECGEVFVHQECWCGEKVPPLSGEGIRS